MRYPDIPLMASTFRLFQQLGYGEGTKIPYHLSTDRDIQLFNGFLLSGPIPRREDPFHVSESKGGNVPDRFALQGYQHWLDEKLDQFKKALIKDFDEGWKFLMEHDSYSFRTYMTLAEPKYPNSVGPLLRVPLLSILLAHFYRLSTGARQWIQGQVYSMVPSQKPSWSLSILIFRRKM